LVDWVPPRNSAGHSDMTEECRQSNKHAKQLVSLTANLFIGLENRMKENGREVHGE
jgi:hypothetical protein